MCEGKTIVLERGNYTSCTINLFGANITSWRIKNIEQLFMSSRAILDETLPIRGGIPIVFPAYGYWEFGPQHGFARLMHWNVVKGPHRLNGGNVEVVLSLVDDDYSRSMWNHSFRLEYRIKLLEKNLSLTMKIYNFDSATSFLTNFLFHPYIRVPELGNCKIAGLEKAEYLDKLTETEEVEYGSIIKFGAYTDRVYKNTKKYHLITNVQNKNSLKFEKNNLPDTVIWNPGSEKILQLSDMYKEDYLQMICIATGYASNTILLHPGECVEMKLVLKVLNESELVSDAEKREQFPTQSFYQGRCSNNS